MHVKQQQKQLQQQHDLDLKQQQKHLQKQHKTALKQQQKQHTAALKQHKAALKQQELAKQEQQKVNASLQQDVERLQAAALKREDDMKSGGWVVGEEEKQLDVWEQSIREERQKRAHAKIAKMEAEREVEMEKAKEEASI